MINHTKLLNAHYYVSSELSCIVFTGKKCLANIKYLSTIKQTNKIIAQPTFQEKNILSIKNSISLNAIYIFNKRKISMVFYLLASSSSSPIALIIFSNML